MRWVIALGMLVGLAACGDAPRAPSVPSTSDLYIATHPPGNASMQALYRGSVTTRHQCVVIGSRGDYAVPVWPEGFTAAQDDSGRVVVRDGDGAVIAVEGERFSMAGGFTVQFEPADKVEPRDEQLRRLEDWLGYAIPDRCLGPDVYGVWIVGDTSPLSKQ